MPDKVLCSTATRTKETLERIEGALCKALETDFEDALYLAETDDIIDVLRSQSDDFRTLMVVGHNPGMEEAVTRLSGPSQDTGWTEAVKKFPTCALAVINFDVGAWRDISKGVLVDFQRPKSLV